MADIKTITEELSEVSADIEISMIAINNTAKEDKEIVTIIQKITEKLDEIIEEVNTLKNL
jgi:hypothetical protein